MSDRGPPTASSSDVQTLADTDTQQLQSGCANEAPRCCTGKEPRAGSTALATQASPRPSKRPELHRKTIQAYERHSEGLRLTTTVCTVRAGRTECGWVGGAAQTTATTRRVLGTEQRHQRVRDFCETGTEVRTALYPNTLVPSTA
jgi:hypothetical protein